MRFLTALEAAAWCAGAGVPLTPGGRPARARDSSLPALRCGFPEPAHRMAWFAGWLVTAVPNVGPRLLWTTEWGIWPSSENWTLVERLRRGYGEHRPHEEAPAVEAAPDEIDDLAAFVQMGMLSGWDLHLLGTGDLLRVFVSHDEFVELATGDAGLRAQIAAELTSGGLQLLS